MFQLYFESVEFEFAVKALEGDRSVAYLGFAIRLDTGLAELIAVAFGDTTTDIVGPCLLVAIRELRARKALFLATKPFHNEMKNGPWTGDYNPTQAGDGTAMSPVTGIYCEGTNSLTLMTMMLDFNHNNGAYPKALVAVCGGRVDETIPPGNFSPYTLETRAHWVPNPAGEPKYYLQLDERFTHLADEKIGKFSYDFADYMPWEFSVRAISPENCPCASSSTNYMAGGWYRDSA